MAPLRQYLYWKDVAKESQSIEVSDLVLKFPRLWQADTVQATQG